MLEELPGSSGKRRYKASAGALDIPCILIDFIEGEKKHYFINSFEAHSRSPEIFDVPPNTNIPRAFKVFKRAVG